MQLGSFRGSRRWISMIKPRPLCNRCLKSYAEKSYNHGVHTGWRSTCYLCRRKGSLKQIKHTNNRNARAARRRARLFKVFGSTCVRCGFVPEHTCQIDFDHIDGNHKNNNLSNMQPLCSNCHRMKTIILAKDHLKLDSEQRNKNRQVNNVRWSKATV